MFSNKSLNSSLVLISKVVLFIFSAWSFGLQVRTLLQNSFPDNSTVNVICQHNGQESWTIQARVLIDDKRVCGTDQIYTTCEVNKKGNQFNFTLKMTAEQIGHPCHCSVYRSSPPPVLEREGEKLLLFPGENHKPCLENGWLY